MGSLNVGSVGLRLKRVGDRTRPAARAPSCELPGERGADAPEPGALTPPGGRAVDGGRLPALRSADGSEGTENEGRLLDMAGGGLNPGKEKVGSAGGVGTAGLDDAAVSLAPAEDDM